MLFFVLMLFAIAASLFLSHDVAAIAYMSLAAVLFMVMLWSVFASTDAQSRMARRLDKVRLAIKHAPAVLHDRLFDIACRLLLPISTYCKVCNMLRGMAIGVVIGSSVTAVAVYCMERY